MGKLRARPGWYSGGHYMNDSTLTEVKIVVERVVRPVRAPMARKRKMREELLAHLAAIFEEEVEKRGDEQAALLAAKRRFGNPQELSSELQRAVSRYDRFDGAMERYIGFRRGDSALGHAVRIATIPWIWFPVMVLLLPLILTIRERQYEIARTTLALVVAHAVMSATGFVLTLLIHGLRRSLVCESRRRSVLLATVYVLVSLALVPLGKTAISWAVSNGGAWRYMDILGLCWSSLLVLVLLLLLARAIAKDVRRQEEWECLEIGN
jgi:hypothetical protein